jgi:hypothetical protein
MAASVPAGAAGIADIEYDNAVRSFRAGRTADAYGLFIDLANRGDPDAARIALFMYSYGATLYGSHWDANPPDVAYWNMLIRNSGTSARPASEFQPIAMKSQKSRQKARTPTPPMGLKRVAVSTN